MPNETLRPLHKDILTAPVVGAGGNHSARLARVVENLLEMDESQRPVRVNHLLARIGGFAGGLAQDLRSGETAVADAAHLLDQLSALGDWAFSGLSEKDGGDRYRRSLCEPAPAIFVAACRLSAAVELHNAGDRAGAEELFRLADDADVRAFTEHGWGKGAAARYGFVATDDSPAYLPKDLRPTPRMPLASTMTKVLKRDGRHCRFCGIPVISAAVRRRVQAVYPAAVTWGNTNGSQHAAFQCMWLQFDHILPNSRGGDSSVGNVVVACAVCNFGRMQATLEEARLVDPLSQATPEVWSGFQRWTGLEEFGNGPSNSP